MQLMKKWIKREIGQSLVLVAFAIAALCGTAALVVDVGMISVAQGKLQNAADAAALAAAGNLPDVASATSTADQYAVLNGVPAGHTAVTSPYNGNAKQVEVVCTMSVPYAFARIFGVDSKVVTARAVAERSGATNGCFGYALFSSATGSLVNPLKISSTFKSDKRVTIAPETVERYISYLEDAFLISPAKRYDLKGRRYIGTPYKLYFTDLGLRNARMNFRQMEETHIMENVIYNELVARGCGVDVGVVPSTVKGEDDKTHRVQLEIDFVCNKGSKRYYIQSAFALPTIEKWEQEQRSLLKVDDGFKKIIVTKEGLEPHYNENGILVMNIYDFLLDKDSLDF